MKRTRWLLTAFLIGSQGMLAGPVASSSSAVDDDSWQVRIIGFNDFHGALSPDVPDDLETVQDEDALQLSTAEFVSAIETARAEAGVGASLLLSAGDSIGVSPFVSSSAQDAPTIELLNLLDVDAMAVGNHELDRGYPWLRSHVLAGEIPSYPTATFPVLAANVTTAAGAPLFAASVTLQASGARVCVVGAVTAETPYIMPLPVGDLKVTDPVRAVNATVANLNAESACDVTVVVLHEGGALGVDATLAQQVAARPVFERIATGLDKSVDAVLTGHKHKRYAYLIPRVGAAPLPVLQAGERGDTLGIIDLTVSRETREVVDVSASLRTPMTTVDPANLRVAQANALVAESVRRASELGNRRAFSTGGPFSRAWQERGYAHRLHDQGKVPNASAESTAGHLVADMLYATPTPEGGQPSLAVVAESRLKGDVPSSAQGVTVAQAYSLFPEEAKLAYVRLTGAQFRALLEQQWSADVSARAALAISSNVQVWFNSAATAGERVTAVMLNGKPLDPQESVVVATDSVVARGWNGFTAITLGTASYSEVPGLQGFLSAARRAGRRATPLRPDQGVRQVDTTLPLSAVEGSEFSALLRGVNLSSTDSPRNSFVRLFVSTPGANTLVGQFPVIRGEALLRGTWPTSGRVVAIVSPSNTRLGQPQVKWRTRLRSQTSYEYDRDTDLTIRVLSQGLAWGSIRAKLPNGKWVSGVADAGIGTLSVGRRLKPGDYRLPVRFGGDAWHTQTRRRVRVRVERLKTQLVPELGGGPQRRALVIHVVSSGNLKLKGSVRITWDDQTWVLDIRHGQVRMPLARIPNWKGQRIKISLLRTSLLAGVDRTIALKKLRS